MCSAPKIEEPTRFQTAKTPVMNTAVDQQQKSGRAGTILTNRGPAQEYTPGGKKTLLGS